MTTRLSNPHFLPEMTIKVQIINFMITFEGLREQLLNLVVRKENEALDQEHEKLIITQYENNKMMRDIEETILKVLKDSKGNILDDERAIVILKHS
jgi:dynein heavy chain